MLARNSFVMIRGIWPLFELSIVTPRLQLRYPSDDDVAALCELAARGVHDPATMPFSIPWTDAPSPELERSSAQWLWRQRAEWSVDRWNAPFVTIVDDVVVGTQGVSAEDFPAVRLVETGSWLGLEHQGKGYATEMRSAVLHFAFAGLNAALAASGAWHDNVRSLAVSSRCGYEPNGRRRVLRRDQPDWIVNLMLPREEWERRRRSDIEIVGLQGCIDMFGLE
jgi:RimJ/RimL family protein N-acetyltransferase